MRLAVDALGGDNAPGEVVAGAIAAAMRLRDDEVILVGPEAEVRAHLPSDAPPNITCRDSGGPVGMDEEPAAALRARPDTGVSVAALDEARSESDRIIRSAQDEAEKITSEEEVLKRAEKRSAEIMEDARRREREIRLGAEDYADEVLANLEDNLGKLLEAVQRGRSKLQGVQEQ